MPTRVVQLLADLVAIPSVNPRRGQDPGGESAVARYISAWARQHGFRTRLEEVLPGRENVYVWVPGTHPGQLLLQSHLDTVEVDDMDAPFTLTEHSGRWYGRGACDAKAQLAIFMTAIERSDSTPHPDILLAGCIDEEDHYRGVSRLCAGGLIDADTIGAIVGEPTNLRCVTAHMGVLRGTLTATGPGGHSSQGGRVMNPIETLAEVISYLAGPERKRLGSLRHPLLPPPTLTVTTVTGGEAINVLPRRVTACYDRRTLPAEDPQAVWATLADQIHHRWPAVTADQPLLADQGLETPPDAGVVKAFRTALSGLGLPAEPIGVPFGSDASKIARLGVACVVFGAGSIEQAHTPNEYVDEGQLHTAVEVISGCLCAAVTK